MVDLSTRFLGLDLATPFIAGASPLCLDSDSVRRLEDAGAAAIVLPSLFEEQIRAEMSDRPGASRLHGTFFGLTRSQGTGDPDRVVGPDEYLDHIARTKSAVRVPVIASINGMTPGGWLWAAALMEQAGADALELNVYEVASDPDETGRDVEQRLLETVEIVRSRVRIPVAVKLCPFFASMTNIARRLERTGVDGLVLFNRFIQADIDPEGMTLQRAIRPSNSEELLLRLHWTAILSARVGVPLGVTGGIYTAADAAKAVLAGAHAIQCVSTLLLNGPGHLADIIRDFRDWMDRHGHQDIESVRGLMNLEHCPDPKAYERANYREVLRSWTPWDVGTR